MASTKQSSRFSTFKVFKLAGSKSESNPKPPPPPPKDRYYLYNRSLSSLSPDSLSMPTTPLSPDYGKGLTPGPSQSTMSLLSSAASISPSTADTNPSIAPKRSFFKLGSLGKRSPKPPSSRGSTLDSEISPEPVDDENISLPWNFQHNIHVDEGYAGIPPSWSSSLSKAGFSDEEITAIHARRAATRSPSSGYLYTDRPRSPGTILTNPTPRTTSLPRQYSNTSIASSSRQRSQRAPPVPSIPNINSSQSAPLRKFSDASSTSSSRDGSNTEAQYVYVNRVGPDALPSASSRPPTEPSERSRSPSNHSSPPPSEQRPRTPPRRQFHVVNNESPNSIMMSPPPAYRSPARGTTFPKEKEGAMGASTPPPPPPEDQSIGNDTLDDEELSVRDSRRLTILPPRLSLHEESDLSSWTESLFSAIPSSDFVEGSSSMPSKSTLKSSPPLLSLPSAPAALSSSLPISSARRPPPQRPIPSIDLREPGHDDPPHQPTTPLWNEIMGMVQTPPSSALLASPLSPGTPFTPALSDGGSTTLPSPRPVSREFGDDSGALLPPSETLERDPNRDSAMSTVSTVTVTAATIIRDASVATRATANVIEPSPSKPKAPANWRPAVNNRAPPSTKSAESVSTHLSKTEPLARAAARTSSPPPRVNSPHNSYFSDSSSEGSRSGSGSYSSRSQEQESQSPISEIEVELLRKSPALPHPEVSPDPTKLTFTRISSPVPPSPREVTGQDTKVDSLDVRRPSIVITGADSAVPNSNLSPALTSAISSSSTPSPSTTGSPATPAQKYRGWQSEVLAPLEEFINDSVDPRQHYTDLVEIAEGESGSVFAANVKSPKRLKLPPAVANTSASVVAIKSIAIVPSGSPKLEDLRKELTLMRMVGHENVLSMDALYVDLVDDALWIRMELMERSLADVVALVGEGLMVYERMIARFASDVLLALAYLQELKIAHQDVRSDNLLLNSSGVLKIADFSSAVQVTPQAPLRSGSVGVIYWQAPEIRSGPYNPLKVDVWSLGATVWEMAQAEPPFADVDPRQIGNQWPPLTQPEIYSRSFHDFLRLCSLPSSSRPNPSKLLTTSFIQNACGRVVIIQLLTQCKTIEERMVKRNSVESQGTIY